MDGPFDMAHHMTELTFDILSETLFSKQIVGNPDTFGEQTVDQRKAKIQSGEEVPDDFMTLLLKVEGPEGLTRSEIEDNVITFIGAGHETTARALGWAIYLLAKAPEERRKVEEEVARVTKEVKDPVDWLNAMPQTRAVFEEAMRLYPPAPTISRDAIEDIEWEGVTITKGTQVADHALDVASSSIVLG
ncbi:Cytochrome P450 4A5 [Nymphon striatum]|nr:Cytochrome P450 4A5 [Nymphon striatum]